MRCGVLSEISFCGSGMDIFLNHMFLVANLASNFQDLVTKGENLVTLPCIRRNFMYWRPLSQSLDISTFLLSRT